MVIFAKIKPGGNHIQFRADSKHGKEVEKRQCGGELEEARNDGHVVGGEMAWRLSEIIRVRGGNVLFLLNKSPETATQHNTTWYDYDIHSFYLLPIITPHVHVTWHLLPVGHRLLC